MNEFIQIAIVTGGNSGIGFETVKHLLGKNAKVYLCTRNSDRAKSAIDELKKMNLPGTVEFLPLDLASLKAIKSFADNYLSKEKTLDMLFNNAGVMNPTVGAETHDGYELHVGTNSLGHHYLTELLLPALQASARATPDRLPRVCFTSSLVHRQTSSNGFDPADYTGLKDLPFYMPPATRAYGTSKVRTITDTSFATF